MKRYRAPKAKLGQLKAQLGKLPHEDPDLCYAWGDGVSVADSHFLHHALMSPEYNRYTNKWEPSFVEELKRRGYDLTTLRFSVEKRVEARVVEEVERVCWWTRIENEEDGPGWWVGCEGSVLYDDKTQDPRNSEFPCPACGGRIEVKDE